MNWDEVFESNGYKPAREDEPEVPAKKSTDERWLAIILTVVVLGMFFIGYGVAYLQWEALA